GFIAMHDRHAWSTAPLRCIKWCCPGTCCLKAMISGAGVSMDMQSLSRNIADAIKEWTGACAVTVTDFRKLSGGAIQSNYNISLEMTSGTHPGSHRFVVRIDAPSQIIASLSRTQEFAVLRCAWEAGVTVPEPLLLCTDRTVIGYAFYVMS